MARKAAKPSAPRAADTKRKVDGLSKIGEMFDLWRPAADVLLPVRGVRTRFLGIDSVTKIGAWPIERVCTVTGPSNEGKTAFCLGLGASFLDGDGFFGLIDAELTTPITWIRSMMPEHADSQRFLATRPASYEAAVKATRQFCQVIERLRHDGKLADDASALLVVDSIRKLTPQNLLDNLLKQGTHDDAADAGAKKKPSRWDKKPKGIDGAGGRAAQIKAALNAQWLDELIPLAAKSGTSIVLIARELGDDDASFFSQPTMAGGKALFYDASLVVRVVKASKLMHDGKYLGDRHCAEVRKTKIGSKDEIYPKAYFHTLVNPARFDPARDAIELGVDAGVIDERGGRYYLGERMLGHGIEQVVAALNGDAVLLHEVQELIRGSFILEGDAMVAATAPSEPRKARKAAR